LISFFSNSWPFLSSSTAFCDMLPFSFFWLSRVLYLRVGFGRACRATLRQIYLLRSSKA
jgi:hypothetical protein